MTDWDRHFGALHESVVGGTKRTFREVRYPVAI
jgi:hypothetical protein